MTSDAIANLDGRVLVGRDPAQLWLHRQLLTLLRDIDLPLLLSVGLSWVG